MLSFDKCITKLHYTKYSVHFRSVKSLSLVQFFATPWTSARQASLSITNFQTLLELISIELVMSSNHVILCCPLICWLAHRLGLETRKTKPWLGAWNFQLSSSRKGRRARNWVNNGLSPHVLKEISPGCSLEGMMLKLKLQYFGYLMWRADSLEKTLMLGGIGGRRKRGRQSMRCLDGITDSMDMSLTEHREMVMDMVAWRAVIHGVPKSWTRLSDRIELNWSPHEEASIKSQLYMSNPDSLIILSPLVYTALLRLDNQQGHTV